MDFSLPGDVRQLQKTVREFIQNECKPVLDTLDPDAVKLPEEDVKRLRKKAKDLGFWAMAVPEEYGGQGIDMLSRVVVREELSRHRLGLYNPGLGVVSLSPGMTVGEPEIFLERASDYQLETYFLPSIRGERRGCFALTEPAAGSDPTGIRTRAEKDGDEWVLNGTKHFITGAQWADYATVFARTGEDPTDISAFLVDFDSPGFTLGREIPVIRPLHPHELIFENARVPEKNVLGEINRGFETATAGLYHGRITYAAASLGAAEESLKMARDHALERKTFGEPLSSRQAIQWMIVNSAMDLHETRLLIYQAAWMVDQGRDIRHIASMTKVKATEMLENTVDNAIQIHGAMGVSKDLPLERWYREARVRRIGEGPSEIQRRTMARNIFEGYVGFDLFER